MHTMREKNGLSGFTSRFESDYDPFGAGHGCNSISAGLGSIYFPAMFYQFLVIHPLGKICFCFQLLPAFIQISTCMYLVIRTLFGCWLICTLGCSAHSSKKHVFSSSMCDL
jgi:hypothetical protein